MWELTVHMGNKGRSMKNGAIVTDNQEEGTGIYGFTSW